MAALRLAKLSAIAITFAAFVAVAPPASAASGWVQATTASPDSVANAIEAVSCVASTFCVAAGYEIGASGYDQTLVEDSTDGAGASWSTMVGTDPAGPSGYNDLYGVSCATTSFCMAVGSSQTGSGAQQALAESYNGSTWATSTVPLPPGSTGSVFNAVDCTNTSFCVAAGYYVVSGGNDDTLVETYDGTGWSLESSSNPGTGGVNGLWGVSCAGTGYCLATGEQRTSSAFQDLALESTDGGISWSPTASPPVEAGPGGGISTNNTFVQVTCIAVSDCFAAGFYDNSSGVAQALMETYNGTWASDTVGSPGSGSDQNLPWSVACESSDLCFMVGGYQSGGAWENLVEESTDGGGTWTAQVNQSSDSYNFLYGVTCVASAFCVAAGSGSVDTFAETNPTPGTCNTSTNNLSGQNLAGCNLAGGNMQGKNLKGADLAGADLSGASVQGSNIQGADLAGADLSGANLQGANLLNADLAGADLSGANLSGANLKGANLSNADLSGAILSGANLNAVNWSNTVCPDGTNSNNDGGTCVNNL